MSTSSSDTFSVVVSVLSAGIGYCIKYFADKYTEKQKSVTDKILENIQFKLKEFYYPIYSIIMRENIIWEKLINIYKEKQGAQDILIELDTDILKTHLNCQKIIQNHIVIVNPPKDLMELLMKYDEHVTVFHALRSVGKLEYPAVYGSPYPRGLLGLLSRELEALKKKQAEILIGDECSGCQTKDKCSCKGCDNCCMV